MTPDRWAELIIAIITIATYFSKTLYEMSRTIRAERAGAKPTNGSAGAQTPHYWIEQFGHIVEDKIRPSSEKLDRLNESHIRLSDAQAETQLALNRMCTVIDERLPRRAH